MLIVEHEDKAGGNLQTDGHSRTEGRTRLPEIVWFRAVAIILIVAGHSYRPGGVHLGNHVDFAISDLVKGATAFFVFISGFVFDHVFGSRYRYWTFLRDRLWKLLVPYCLLTLLAGVMFSNWAAKGVSIDDIFRAFILGDTFQAYWYIPFILLMFALAPLHRLFMRLSWTQQIAVIVLGFIVGGLVQRPVGNDNALQSVVFYLPLYLSGLFLSRHRTALLPRLKRGWPVLVLAAVAIAGFQAATGQSDNLHKPLFTLDKFELMGLQKLALSFGLIGVFATFSSPPRWTVRIIADTSFAIFFLHPFALVLLRDSTIFQLTQLPWIDLAIATAAIVTLCAAIALALRTLLRSGSKYLIGY